MHKHVFMMISYNKNKHLREKKDVEKLATKQVFIHIIHTLETETG